MWKQERQVWRVLSWRKCTQQQADLSFSTSPFATPLPTNQQHREIMTSHEETLKVKRNRKKKNGKSFCSMMKKHTQLFSHHDIKTVKKKREKNATAVQFHEPAIFLALTEISAFAYDTTLWKQIMLFSASEFSASWWTWNTARWVNNINL